MLRKRVLPRRRYPTSPTLDGELIISAVATVEVTSEDGAHPIDHAFDAQRGPGSSRWLAGEPGEQTVALAFDRPHTLRFIGVEIEELAVSRTQELAVAVSCDGGRTYRELVRQEFTFSPPGTTFEREVWARAEAGVTHLRLDIKPDKGGHAGRATLTALILA
jgi:hypothetical protein